MQFIVLAAYNKSGKPGAVPFFSGDNFVEAISQARNAEANGFKFRDGDSVNVFMLKIGAGYSKQEFTPPSEAKHIVSPDHGSPLIFTRIRKDGKRKEKWVNEKIAQALPGEIRKIQS